MRPFSDRHVAIPSLSLLPLACFALVCLGLSAENGRANDFMTSSQAARLGLVEAWQRQISLPIGATSIIDQQLHVHGNLVREYVEVVREIGENGADENASSENASSENEVLLRIPTDRIDSFGNPIGKKEAERLANNEVRRFKRRGIEAKVVSREVPVVRLYTLAEDGTVESRDAETGEVVWIVRVGERRYRYLGMGVGDKYATIINGGNMIELDVLNGETIASVAVVNMPIYGALQVGNYSIFASIRNGIEAYSLTEPDRVPFRETVVGQALAIPTRAPQSEKLAWTTDREFFYCMEASGNPSVLFRLGTDGIVSGRVAAASGDRFYFGSEAGQIYGVQATRSGKVLWSKPYGEPFYDTPIVAANQLLIRSAFSNLLSLDLETGNSTWQGAATGIHQLLGMVEGKVFATSSSGSLVILDLKTGDRIETINDIRPSRVLPNSMTDRLYLVGSSGYVQCLRAKNALLPSFQAGYGTKLETEEAAGDETTDKAKTLDRTPGFGDPASPFEQPDSDPKNGTAEDPFGGGGDPFGGGGDPFGGDPFGG